MINPYISAWLSLPILKFINDIYEIVKATAATNMLLVILPVGLFLAAALFAFIYYYSYRLTEEETNKLIKFSGYRYDESQDIFYNHDNVWQEDFGYCKLYDDALALLGMIIDCEPIYFEHDKLSFGMVNMA